MYFSGHVVSGHVALAWVWFGLAQLGCEGEQRHLAGIKMYSLLAAKDNSSLVANSNS